MIPLLLAAAIIVVYSENFDAVYTALTENEQDADHNRNEEIIEI